MIILDNLSLKEIAEKGFNVCYLRCHYASAFSPKRRTCYCGYIRERAKCVVECDILRGEMDAIT